MSERSFKEDAIGASIFGAALVGGVLSATFLAEHEERSYDPDRVVEISAEIDEVDDKAIELLEGDKCHVSIYGFLRSTNDFPTERTEIANTMTRTCADISDETVRLLDSYTDDISSLLREQGKQEDYSHVTGVERVGFAAGSIVLITMFGNLIHGAARLRRKK